MQEIIEEYGATIAIALFGLLIILGLITVLVKIAQGEAMKEMIEEYGGLIAAGLGGAVIVGILALVLVPGSPINKLLVAVLP